MFFLAATFFCNAVLAQRPAPPPNRGAGSKPGLSPLEGGDATVGMDVYVRGADGGPIEVTAVVTLVAATGQVVAQGTTLGGNIQFNGIAATEYTIQVTAPGYENAAKEFDGYNAAASRVVIDMRPASSGEKGAGPLQMLLAPKAQKELAKALEALRSNKPEAARRDRKSTRLNSSHSQISYAVFCLKKKKKKKENKKKKKKKKTKQNSDKNRTTKRTKVQHKQSNTA